MCRMSCYSKFVQLRLPTHVTTYSPNILDILVRQVIDMYEPHSQKWPWFHYPDAYYIKSFDPTNNYWV